MHTPGPWRIRPAKLKVDGGMDYAIIAGERDIIAETFEVVDYGKHMPSEANARLIAAAPDLLEALRQIINLCGGKEPYGTMRAVWRVADAALAKAEGKS